MSMPTYGEMRSRAEQFYDENVKKKVLLGLKALQEQHGPGWEDEINCARLDLRSASQCVLGQVYGSFDDGLDQLVGLVGEDEQIDWSIRHGFSILGYSESWERLDEAWHQVLCDA